MARVTGPLMSIDASGTLADTLTFAKWKGRNYTRQRVIPTNPRSALQTGVRAMMAYLAQIWASIGSTPQGTWDDDAEANAISPFNQFVKANMNRWASSYGPSFSNPAAEEGSDLVAPTSTKTGGAGYVDLSATPDGTDAADAVGCIIYRAAAEITAVSRATAIAVIPVTPGEQWTYTDSGLDAGTYHYRVAYFSNDGALGTAEADDTATVT